MKHFLTRISMQASERRKKTSGPWKVPVLVIPPRTPDLSQGSISSKAAKNSHRPDLACCVA